MRAHITLTPRQFIIALASVGISGAIGTLLRDLILRIDSTHWYLSLVGGSSANGALTWYAQIPWTLMFINIIGVYTVATLLVGRLRAHDPNNLARLMIVTGFFGGFTSYSTLFVSLDTMWQVSKFGAIGVGFMAILSGVGAAWLAARRRHR
ncbi:MAG: CrcB family protein [Acidobacteria bacterium]|nr:CrcB family protein [Acidobacteriota bacterium]